MRFGIAANSLGSTAKQMTLVAGTTLGPYEILSPLGKGGMGEVYRAHDARLGRDVAVKVLPERLARNADALARFEREARAVAALSHPNILTVFDVGSHDGVSYVVTELLEGETLRSQLRAGPLPWHKAVEIGGHIADGLAAAHEKSVIHRDLKPENIFLTSSGVVKILDFGLARFAQTALPEGGDEARTLTLDTKPGTVLGTAHYMSPEQVRGKLVDARSDIFSLGCVLHEMVTGTKTFSGDTSADLMTAILKEDPPSMIDSCGDVSPEFERVVARCLEKRPEQRFHAASDLAFTLRTLVSGSGSSGAAGKYVEPRSRRALGLVVGVVAVAVILVTVFLMTREKQAAAPSAAARVVPLTSFVGIEGSPSYSPGGDFVAFDYNPKGPSDIYVMSSSGGPHRLIVQSPADDVRPRWSPDNRYLAFISGRGLTAAVYLVPPFGGTEQRIVGTGVPAVEFVGKCYWSLGAQPWSPDAKKLLFSNAQPAGGIAVCEIDVGSRDQRQLTQPGADQEDLSATYTSDGKRIAFARRRATQADLLVLDADTGELRVVLADGHRNLEPAWSTDDGRLIFSSDRSGVVNLWELDLSSNEARRLTTGQGADKDAVVAPDGRIAYHQFSHQTDLYLLSVDDDGASTSRTAARRLTSNTKDNFGARFSPDGTKILYHSSRSGNFELWRIDLADGAERQLTSDPHTDVFGDWSPDGGTISFVSDRDGELRLWKMDADGGGPRRISPKVVAMRTAPYYSMASIRPSWSADGKAIAYLADTEEGSALWTMKADGSEAHAIVPGVLGFDWYIDSHRIVYSRMAEGRDDVKEMRARNLETGDEVVLLQSPHQELIVSADGTFVAYCKAASHYDMDLYRLKLQVPADANGLPAVVGEPQRLTQGQERWHVHNGSWSPDGKQIVYTRDTDSADISIIEGVK